MASAGNSVLKQFNFYKGLVPGASHFFDIQNAVLAAIQRMQQRFMGAGDAFAATLKIPAYSVGSAFDVTVDPNTGIDKNGLSADWESGLAFDATTATHGDYTGTTAPAASTKRYIILAAAHDFVESDPQTSPRDGLTYNYQKLSNTTARVYALAADVALADTWYSNASLAALFDAVIAAGAIPLLICERRNGTTTFAAGDVHSVDRCLAPQGTPLAETEFLRELMGRAFMGYVLNDTGLVAGSGVAVPSTPGRIDVTGGETVAIGVAALGTNSRYRLFGVRRITIPATSLSFGALSTQYIVRLKLDPVTGEALVYKGTGDYPNDTWPGAFAAGTVDGSNQGFIRTAIDIPLFKVVTGGSNGLQPTVTQLANLSGGVRTTADITLVDEIGTSGSYLAGSSLHALLQSMAVGDFPFEGVMDLFGIDAQKILINQTSASDVLDSDSVAPLQVVVSNDSDRTWKLLYKGKFNDWDHHLSVYIEHSSVGRIALVFNAAWDEVNEQWDRSGSNHAASAIIFWENGIRFYALPNGAVGPWDDWGTDPSFALMEFSDSGFDTSLLKGIGSLESNITKTDVLRNLAASSGVTLASSASDSIGLAVRAGDAATPIWVDSLNTNKAYAHLTRSGGAWTVRKGKLVASASDSGSPGLDVVLSSALLTNDPYPIILCQQVGGSAIFSTIALRLSASTIAIQKYNPTTGSATNWANDDAIVVTVIGSTAE